MICALSFARRALSNAHATTWANVARRARAYAKPSARGIAPSPSALGARAGAMRIIPSHAGVIADPFGHALDVAPSFVECVTSTKGMTYAWRRATDKLKDAHALSTCAKHIKGFSLEGFKLEAQQMFRAINAGVANGVSGKTLGNEVRHATTDATQTDLKRERRSRELGGWTRIDWALESMDAVSVVRGRLIMASVTETVGFAQLTTRFRSKQRFAAYDASGRLVAGDPNATIDVVDHWVFEHGLNIPNSRWRLAGRLRSPTSAESASVKG